MRRLALEHPGVRPLSWAAGRTPGAEALRDSSRPASVNGHLKRSETDEELERAWRSGDRHAFGALFRHPPD